MKWVSKNVQDIGLYYHHSKQSWVLIMKMDLLQLHRNHKVDEKWAAQTPENSSPQVVGENSENDGCRHKCTNFAPGFQWV